MPRKAFTVREANALLPRLEDALREIAGARDAIAECQAGLGILRTLWGEAVTQFGNPDFEEYDALCRRIDDQSHMLERIVREEIVDQGLRFPSGGLQYGLIDFPTTYHGRWVYLCWRNGEERVAFWHEVDAGYGGRTPITPEQATQMGLPDDPALQDDSALDF
jgi:hypothetical protein